MFPSTILEELQKMHIVLASSSKTRENLLRQLNINIEVCKPKFDENLNPDDYSVTQYVEETALGKVLNVEERLNDKGVKPDIIIGADTMVEHEGKLHGKPKTKEDAIAILTKLTSSGSPNIVHTGVVIKCKGQVVKFVESTIVYMGVLSRDEILAYVDTGEPMGNAGGFAIQGVAGSFIERIEGDYNNVTGLPLCRLRKELKKLFSCNGFSKNF